MLGSNSDAGPCATIWPRYRITIRSATANTSLRLCETTSTATPCEASRLIRLKTILVCATPSAAVGSSMITSFAFDMTALATATDCRWPPDSDATGWRIERIVVTESSSSVCLCGRAPSSPRRADRCRERLVAEEHVLDDVEVVAQRQVLVDRGDPERPRRRAARGSGPACPSHTISPSSGGHSPAIVLIVTDLPAPLSPASAVTWPGGISKLTRVSACTGPNRLVIPAKLQQRPRRSSCSRQRLARSPGCPKCSSFSLCAIGPLRVRRKGPSHTSLRRGSLLSS